jgi:hypothetical protein
MPSKEEIDEFHRELRILISESGRQSDEGTITGNNWILNVIHGKWVVNILHPLNKKYIALLFRFQLSDEDKDVLIEGIQETMQLTRFAKLAEFDYELRSAITFQNAAYSIIREKSSVGVNIPVGFEISVKLFPFDKQFSIDCLDYAIQNVINFGVLGISLFRTKIIPTEELIEIQRSMDTAPIDMYD